LRNIPETGGLGGGPAFWYLKTSKGLGKAYQMPERETTFKNQVSDAKEKPGKKYRKEKFTVKLRGAQKVLK